jgi:hypothetical protein
MTETHHEPEATQPPVVDHAGLSAYDRSHVEEILHGHGTWFSAHLLRLCSRADDENLARTASAFPHHVAAYIAWRSGGVA